MADFLVFGIVGVALILVLLFVGLPAFNRRFQGKNIMPLQNQRPLHVDARFDDVIGEQVGFTNYQKAGVYRYTLLTAHKMDELDGRPEDYYPIPAINRTVIVHKSIAEPFYPKLKEYRERIRQLDDHVEFLTQRVIELERDPMKRVKDTMQSAEAFVKAKGGGMQGGFKR